MFDASLGGPIKQDRVWFFGAFRRSDLENGISRTGREVALLEAYTPTMTGEPFEPFNNTYVADMPYVKVTAQLNPNHELNGY